MRNGYLLCSDRSNLSMPAQGACHVLQATTPILPAVKTVLHVLPVACNPMMHKPIATCAPLEHIKIELHKVNAFAVIFTTTVHRMEPRTAVLVLQTLSLIVSCVPSLDYLLDLGAAAITLCKCKQNYYGTPGVACEACPTGAVCDGSDIPPYAQPGYWQSADEPDHFIACIPPQACLGGKENLCATGYTGARCGACVGPTYYRLGDYCDRKYKR